MDTDTDKKLPVAAEIREALDEIGDDSTFKQIEVFLAKKGIVPKPQQVSNEKRKRRERYKIEDLPISVIKKVQALVQEVGTIEHVRRALDELEKLQTVKR